MRVIKGEVYDVAVDMRKDSPTFGQWYGGFFVLSDYAEFCYKCTDFYHPNDEGGLAYNDPEIGIDWPIPEGMELVMSEKDMKWGSIAEYR